MRSQEKEVRMCTRSSRLPLAPAKAEPGAARSPEAGNGHTGRAHFWRAALAGLAAFWGGLATLVVIAPLA